ncbi:MAG: SRPBCC family protein [Actinomycetes bacterium]
MRTHYEFTLPVPATVVWRLLADADRALGWVPGAEITGIGARSCSGSLKLRVRSTSATYRGTAQLIAKDEATGVLAAQLEGSQTRGAGTLKADVEITVGSANGSGSVVSITAEFAVTGPVTDNGGVAVEGAVDRLLARFASNVENAVEQGAAEGLEQPDAAPLPPVPDVAPGPAPAPAPPAPPDDKPAGGVRLKPVGDVDTQPAFATYGGRTRRASLPAVARVVAAATAVVGLVAAVRRLRRR